VLEEMLPEMGFHIDQVTFSLVGYGNVGSWTGRLLAQRGARLKAVLDHTGAILNERGLDAEKLAAHVLKIGGVANFAGGEKISDATFYSTPVDLLIPAALEQMITPETAARLKCKVVVEAANAPTTPRAEAYLVGQGVAILPAILCNAGGVTVSYFEWKQNRQAEQWDAEVVDRQLKKQMISAARRVTAAARTFQCDMHTASYCAALEHVGEVYKLRGIFP